MPVGDAMRRAAVVLPTLPFTNLPMNTCRMAQRVKGAAHQGLTLTQRRDITTRFSYVGIGCADLPSGERLHSECRRAAPVLRCCMQRDYFAADMACEHR